MSDDPRDRLIAAHIQSIHARAEPDGQRLAAAIAHRCWPGGEDRIEPGALPWVRLWGPRGLAFLPPRVLVRGRALSHLQLTRPARRPAGEGRMRAAPPQRRGRGRDGRASFI
jgi:hypothetical protein